MNKRKFLKFFGKYMVYMGILVGVAGIVYSDILIFANGFWMITFGCLLHEYTEE